MIGNGPASVLHREYPYYNNVKVDQRLLGLHTSASPMAMQTSAARLDMYASHMNQAMVLDGAQWPHIFAGSENNLGEYEFSTTRRNQDIHIIATIPKYAQVYGPMEIKKNPAMMVIYVGADDQLLHCMEIKTYTQGSDGFGYINVFENTHRLQPGQFIPQDMRLVTSPIHKNGLYCMGTNANVVFMSREETIEDAVMISQSLADRMTTTEIHQKVITIQTSYHPINKYGDDIETKFIPDISETVGEDGILCAFRPVSQESFVPDVMQSQLEQLQVFHDEIYYAEPGSEILDISFAASRTYKAGGHLFGQVDKYLDGNTRYWKGIIDVYNKHYREYNLAPEMNTLVNNAIQRLVAAGASVTLPTGMQKQPKVKLLAKNKRPIEFLQMTVTYMTKRACSRGFKICTRMGSKGVVCKVVPDADMPVDDHGFRGDICIAAESVMHRMNVGNFYEQGINRCSEFVKRKVAALYPVNRHAAAEMLLDYYNDINPNFSNLIRTVKHNDPLLFAHVEDVISPSGFPSLHIPPGLDTIGLDLMSKLEEKWEVGHSPVTYTQRDEDGNFVGTFRTKNNIDIGSIYLYLLCKIPDPSSPGVAHVNQYHTPMKTPPIDQIQYPIRRNPTRFGEDEHRVMVMDLEDPSEAVRLMCLQANSQIGVNLTTETILDAEFPTRLNRIDISNEALLNSNTIVRLFRHMLATTGLGSTKNGPRPIRRT